MSIKKEQLFKEVMEFIEKENITAFYHLMGKCRLSYTTLNRHFQPGSKERLLINEAMLKNIQKQDSLSNKKTELFELSKTKIKENKICKIIDLVLLLPVARVSWYRYFPPESEERKELDRLISENKTKRKYT